jgi:DNA-directed RNA polymerase sigma subunit (sigma70/sigma32)
MKATLPSLAKKERQAITLLYGLDGSGRKAHLEVAEICGIDPDEVAQIDDRVLSKVKQAGWSLYSAKNAS